MTTLQLNTQNIQNMESIAINFNNDFVEYISNIITHLSPQPKIFLINNGTVQIECGEEHSRYLEIEITPEYKMSIFKITANGNNILKNFRNVKHSYLEKIKEEIKTFYAK